MKIRLTIIFFCIFMIGPAAFAQNVGIGTNTPNTKLDVSGAIRHQETNNLTITNSSTNTLPANVSEVQLIAGSGLSQGFTLGTLSAANSYFVGQDLLIYNNTNYACTFGSYTIPALQVMHFIYTNTAGSTTVFGWVAASPASSGGTSYWGTSGNTGTTASTSGIGTAVNSNFIGNTDAKDFVLATNNLERMRITSAGYIGINTTSPNTSLDVRTTDAIQFPAGSTAQRPATPQPGFTRYNTDASIASLEYWNGSQWININQAQVPIGTVAPYAGSTAPLGWAICDGSAVSRTTYSALFAIIGTTYGAGDGSTTFNLPDMRGKAAFGYSSTSGIYNTLGGTGGATSYTPSIGLGTLAVSIPALNASLPAHTHAVPPHYHSMSSSGASLVTTANNTGYESSHTHLVPGQTVTTSSGGSHSHAVGLRSIDGGYAASTVNAFYYGFSNPNSNNTNTTDRGPTTTSTSGNGLIQYDGVHTHTVTTSAVTDGPGSAHNHSIPALALTGSIGNVTGSGAVSGDASFNTTSTSSATITTTAASGTVSGSLSASPMNTYDPYEVVNYIIKTNNTTGSNLVINVSTGTLGQTLYNNGTTWTPTSNLYNSGVNVGVGTTSPSSLFSVGSGSSSNFTVNGAGAITATTGITNSGNESVGGTETISGNATVSGGTLSLNNGTSNTVSFGTAGLAGPSTTGTPSIGTRLLLYPATGSPSTADWAIGMTTGAIWYGASQAISTHAHIFYGGANELMRIRGDGNVGIGTSSPTSMLSVGSGSPFQVTSAGAIAAATGIISSGTIQFSGLTGSSSGSLVAASSTGVLSIAGASTTLPLSGGTGITIGSGNTINSLWTASGTNIYNNNSGNILIGSSTLTPTQTLSIVNATGSASGGSEFTTHGLSIMTGESASGSDWMLYMGADKSAGAGYIQAVDYHCCVGTLLLNARGGNVGVGSATASYPLDVSGSLRSTAATYLATGGGGVGIGTTTIGNTLTVNGSVGIWNANQLAFYTDAGSTQKGWVGQVSGSDFELASSVSGATLRIGANNSNIAFFPDGTINSGFNPKVIISSAGFIGVNTTSPNYPVDIENKVCYNNNCSATETYYYMTDGGSLGAGTINNGYTQSHISLYVSGRLFQGEGEIDFASDRRIKDVIGISNSADDLERLMKIQVTDFRYKDYITHGNKPKKAFIAQQIETVYPEAINLNTEFIPDVYALASKTEFNKAQHTCTLQLDKEHGLSVGDTIRLNSDNGKLESVVTEVGSPRSLTVKWDQEPAGYVFVYGRKIHDFRSVDYDRIYSLNVSATQELAIRVEDMKCEMEKLREENKALKSENADLNKSVKNIDSKYDQLKAQIGDLQSTIHPSNLLSKK